MQSQLISVLDKMSVVLFNEMWRKRRFGRMETGWDFFPAYTRRPLPGAIASKAQKSG